MSIVLNRRADFTLANYRRVAWEGQPVVLGAEAMASMQTCRAAFERLIEDPDVVIYGVTSGYGQQARLRLSAEERKAHAAQPPLAARSSFGEPLPERVTRGMVFARLTNFVEGHAAITPALAEAVAGLLDGRALPSVPALGNGCPGEIQALAHLFGPLAEAVDLREKDALSLINGSPCATALLADASFAAHRRLARAEAVFALAWQALMAPLEHLDPALDALWGDPHEQEVLARLRGYLEGAAPAERRPYQAPVSWRIVPRVLGQAARAGAQAQDAAATALTAVTDNPVFLPPNADHPNGRCLSTGGYHNAAAYPALDNLAAAWADLALLCDRQVTKLLDGAVSLLPPQLVTAPGAYIGTLGFTAVAYAEQARQAAQRTFLPGSEGGGFGQNDVPAPSFFAWRKEAETGRCLDAALAILAAVASQALHITGNPVPPALTSLLEEVRALMPPVEKPSAPAAGVAALAERFTRSAFAS
jgi:histidine ammonia-lyase